MTMAHMCLGAECACITTDEVENKTFHDIDGKAILCRGRAVCPVCMILLLAQQARTTPRWEWYAEFLMEYAVREAWACKQKLQEYGFSTDDVFAPIRTLAYDHDRSWWRIWYEQGYLRHGCAVERLLSAEVVSGWKKAAHKRIADLYGYTSLGIAKLRQEKK